MSPGLILASSDGDELLRWRGGGGVGREVRVFTVFWLSDEYHHSRNWRKKTPRESEVDRDTATPLAACDINHQALWRKLPEEQ